MDSAVAWHARETKNYKMKILTNGAIIGSIFLKDEG